MQTELSFEKGMSQDSWLQPPGTFYTSSCFSLVDPDRNLYALNSHRGNEYAFSLTKNYRPVGGCARGNYIAIFAAKPGRAGGEIGRLSFDRALRTAAYTPIYNNQELPFFIDRTIESDLFIENEEMVRLIWTDRVLTPKTLNFADSRFYTNIPSGSLIAGTEYMVVSGEILYNGVTYGPNASSGLTSFIANATAIYGLLSLSALVIQPPPLRMMDWTPEKQTGNLTVVGPIPGNVPCGTGVFTYQLIDDRGAASSWSPVTFPVRFAGPDPVGYTFQAYQQHQGHPFDTNSSQGVRLRVDRIDLGYTRIRIAFVRGTDYQVYEQPVVIFDSGITGSSMTFDYTGAELLAQLTEEDIREINVLLKRVKSFTIINNLLIPANISKAQDVRWDPSAGVTAKNIEYECLTDVMSPVTALNGPTYGAWATAGIPGTSGTTFDRIWPAQWYKVVGGPIIYCGTTYSPGQYFKGIPIQTNAAGEQYTSASGGFVKPVILIKKYDNLGSPVYQEVELNNDFYDGKGMTASHYVSSLWRDEKYRYFLYLTDAAGNIGYMRWLQDKTVPAQHKLASDIDPDTGQPIGFDMGLVKQYALGPADWTAGRARWTARHIGTEFNGINFNNLCAELGISLADLPKYFSGFGIARCPRDGKIIAQGIMYLCTESQTGSPRTIYPIGTEKAGDDENYTVGNRKPFVYAFYSPDHQLRFNGRPDLSLAEFAETAAYIFPDLMTGTWYECTGRGRDYMYKYGRYDTVPAGAVGFGNKSRIDQANSLDEVEYGSSLGMLGTVFDNRGYSAGFSQANGDDSYGARCSVLLLDNQNKVPLDPWSLTKPIINLISNKQVFYGGDSEAAKASNQAILTPHYQAFDSDFISMLIANSGICNGIQVFGGDAHIGFYGFERMIHDGSGTYSIGVVFPVESHANYHLREGRTFGRSNAAHNFNNGIQMSNPEQFIYSGAYSNTYLTAPYDALPANYRPVSRFPYRGLYSLQKVPGETSNSFTVFKQNNFRDVLGTRGEINAIRGKQGKLFYWQDDAVGYIPVNERAVIPAALGQATILGEGGVMQRFDERTSHVGCQHQYSLTETPEGFVWVDGRRRALYYMTVGLETIDVGQAKSLMGHLNEVLQGAVLVQDNPTAFQGISGVYDPILRRTYITIHHDKPLDKTIIFDQITNQFGGLLPLNPSFYLSFADECFAFTHQQNENPLLAGNYVVGDIRQAPDGDFYVSITNYNQATAGDPRLLPFRWVRLNNYGDAFAMNRGQIGRFFNYVFPSVVVIRTMTDQFSLEKVFDNLEWNSSNEFFTSIECSNEVQVAQDQQVVGNPEYEYRNKKWFSSIPLADDGRLIGTYIDIKATKDNRLDGNPTVSSNERIVLRSLAVIYRKAY